MKILQIAFVGIELNGVEKKILGQFRALKDINKNNELVLITSASLHRDFQLEIEGERIKEIVVHGKRGLIGNRRLKFDIINEIIGNYDPKDTVIFMRYPGADLYFWRFLRKNKEFRIFTEHQEIENKLRQGYLNGNFLIDFSDFIFGGIVRREIYGFVSVTSQIQRNQLSYLGNIENKPSITIGNGISSSEYVTRNDVQFSGNELVIMFVGGGYKTHGLHRLIYSLFTYLKEKNNLNVIINVFGDSSEMQNNIALVEKLGLKKHFVFHGFKSYEFYHEYYERCHIAMGTLSFNRIGLNETSTLKLREYCSVGIPFFHSGIDTDFGEEFIFQLRLPDNDLEFDFNLLVDFANRLNQINNISHKMHDYANEHLDWKVKMRTLSEFINKNVE